MTTTSPLPPTPGTPDGADPAGGAGADAPGPRRGGGRALLAALALVALVAAVLVTLATASTNQAPGRLIALLALTWAVFAVAAAALLRAPVRTAVPLLLVGAVALQVVAVAFAPRWTDDFYRYAWDGRVQAAGIDPYRYAPVDPVLAPLRDDWLFPPGCRDASPPCTRMNHPTDPTIYPPVAQAEFLAVHLLTRPLGAAGGGTRSWQILGALLALATTGILVRRLSRRGDPRRAVLWAWCPTVVFECGNNAHVDALAALLVVLGLIAAATGRRALAGLGIGAAVATKLLPVLAVPALLAPLPRRGDGGPAWRAWARRTTTVGAALLAVPVLTYLPHLLAVGPRVLGFLPAYLQQEGYADGHSRFALLRPLLPSRAAAVVAVAILLAVAVAVAVRGDPRRPWSGALVLTGTALALGGVTYPWYPLLLVAIVALDGRWEWLAVAVPSYVGYLAVPLHLPFSDTQRVGYGLALTTVLAVGLARRRRRQHEPEQQFAAG